MTLSANQSSGSAAVKAAVNDAEGSYDIQIEGTKTYTVTASADITVIPNADEGYEVDTVTYKGEDSDAVEIKADSTGKYIFTMPSSGVSIAATIDTEWDGLYLFDDFSGYTDNSIGPFNEAQNNTTEYVSDGMFYWANTKAYTYLYTSNQMDLTSQPTQTQETTTTKYVYTPQDVDKYKISFDFKAGLMQQTNTMQYVSVGSSNGKVLFGLALCGQNSAGTTNNAMYVYTGGYQGVNTGTASILPAYSYLASTYPCAVDEKAYSQYGYNVKYSELVAATDALNYGNTLHIEAMVDYSEGKITLNVMHSDGNALVTDKTLTISDAADDIATLSVGDSNTAQNYMKHTGTSKDCATGIDNVKVTAPWYTE